MTRQLHLSMVGEGVPATANTGFAGKPGAI